MSRLVIVQCGKRKIWDDRPDAGAVRAEDAYTSSYFRGNREYAKRLGGRWVVLSAKYGFIDPDFLIPGNYSVTFKKRSSGQVTDLQLRAQVRSMSLDSFDEIVVLGGEDYAQRVKEAFRECKTKILLPLEGLSLFEKMSKVRSPLTRGGQSMQ